MMKTKTIFQYSGLLLFGLLLGYLFFGGSNEPQSTDEHVEEAHTDEEGNVVYTCSMHPQVRQNEPGNCPICGMELIPADDGAESADNPYTLTMTQASIKLAEIQTTPVVMDRPVSTFTLPGKVTENKNSVSNVTAHFPGRIRDLYVDYLGTYVSEGQRLASIYSPELIAAQQELLETAKHKSQNPRLYEASRRKLLLWEFPESTINEIEQSGEIMTELDFYSPVSGYVSELMISREDHVMEGTMMYRIVDLTTVWVDFQAFESNISSIEEGDNLQFSVEALPGQTFESTVIYVDPFLDDNSRTATIRARVQNPNNRLKPGMFAEASVQSSISQESQLMVPRSAIMWTGKRSIAYVQVPNTEEPTFEAREVVLGKRAGNFYVIESGLSEGEEVVTNGTFKIDSAAQLSDKLSMMNRNPGTGANRTGHEGHTMPNDSDSSSPGTELNMQEAEVEMSSIPGEFKTQLKMVLTNYLDLKNALFDSDTEAVSEYAQNISSSLEDVDMTLLQGDAHMRWMDFLENIEENNQQIADSDQIEEQRTAFIDLSSNLIEAVNTFEVPGVVFQQFCPMANDGKGAYWLSAEEQIQNPYYGDKMHSCGETVQRIEF